MSANYAGPVRILATDGVLLTVGTAELELDPGMGNWSGILRTLDNTGVAGKALVVQLETPDGRRGTAQLTPRGEVDGYSFLEVVGLDEAPFD